MLKRIWKGIKKYFTTVVCGILIGVVIGTGLLYIRGIGEGLLFLARKIDMYELRQRREIGILRDIFRKAIQIAYENDEKQLDLMSSLIITTQGVQNNIARTQENVITVIDIMANIRNDMKGIKDNIINLKKIDKILQRELKASQKIDVEKVEDIKKANVIVINYTKDGGGSGTHIKINGRHYILTCAHGILEDTDEMGVILENGNKHPLQLAKINRKKDLALFRIYGIDKMPYLELSDETPKEGSKVIVIGNPDAMTDVITEGVIANIDGTGYLITNIIYFGNSGGAVIYKGEVVGVISEFVVLFEPPVFVNYGYAIKLEVIKDFLEEK